MERTINFLFQRGVRARSEAPAFLPGLNGGGEVVTYGQLGEMVRGLALGLRVLGMEKGARVGLVSTNRPEWAVADFGVMHAGCVTVALFPTLPAGQVVRALEDSGAETVIVSDEVQLRKVLGWARGGRGRRVVVMERAGTGAGTGVLTLDEVMELGRKEGAVHDFDAIWQGVGPRDPASIVYTSGTTGSPLGVVLSHRCLVASVEAAEDAVNFLPGECIVSFLPLNHVLARLADHLLPLTAGASVAYAAGAREIGPLVKAVRPQYITLVPRVLEMFRGGVLGAVEKAPPETREAFWRFFEAGLERLRLIEKGGEEKGKEEGEKGAAQVFRRIREDMGLGRLKFFVCGGAPLPVETARFFRVLGLEVIEGYGLTETTALVSVNRPGRARLGTVGQAVKGVEVRLGEDGEILVRGGVVMDGYWKRPEETASALLDGGWLRTGDMGRLESEGYLRIGGRLKELIVLSTGKNVAPLHVEERLCQSPFISQAVVAGDGRSVLSALVVPDFARVRAWISGRGAEEGTAESNGAGRVEACMGGEASEDPSDEDLARDPQVRGLVREEIKRLCAGLAGYEQVSKFALLPRPFSAEHGELTPTMKIRRRNVLERYSALIDSLYGDVG